MRRIWSGRVKIFLNNLSSEELYRLLKSARSAEQKNRCEDSDE